MMGSYSTITHISLDEISKTKNHNQN